MSKQKKPLSAPNKGNSAAVRSVKMSLPEIRDLILPVIRSELGQEFSRYALNKAKGWMNGTHISTASVKGTRMRGGNSAGGLRTNGGDTALMSGAVTAAPVSYSRRYRNKDPSLRMGNGKAFVTHREYLNDIAGSVAFGITTFFVNPGNSVLFPWLSTLARSYESYRFLRLNFCYETLTSTATVGTVMMAIDFDAGDVVPTNKVTLMNFNNSVRGSAWESIKYISAAKDMQTLGPQRFIRIGSLTAVQAVQAYDMGNFYIATQGFAGTNTIGELYVEYEIELITPSLDTVGNLLAASARINANSIITNGQIFGVAPIITGGLPIIAGPNSIDFKVAGDYQITLRVAGTVLVFPGTIASGGLVIVSSVSSIDVGLLTYTGFVVVSVPSPLGRMQWDFSLSGSVTNAISRMGPYSSSLGLDPPLSSLIQRKRILEGIPLNSEGCSLPSIPESKEEDVGIKVFQLVSPRK